MKTLIVLALVIAAIWWWLNRDRAKVNKYEYLSLLSLSEWKLAKNLRLDMQALKNGWINVPRFFLELSHLQDEGLIECDIRQEKLVDPPGTVLKRYFYKLTPKGHERALEFDRAKGAG